MIDIMDNQLIMKWVPMKQSHLMCTLHKAQEDDSGASTQADRQNACEDV